ncbi:MAG: hypothetical protein ABJO36_07595 [Litorimonas sp.]
MTHSTTNNPIPAEGIPTNKKLVKHFGTFLAGMVGTSLLCLGAYALTVDRLIERSAIPATYKWFLLKETPGPRIIFESGSNSHHAINTDAVGKALGRTAINIADNGGYALEDKLTRLETYARPGDVLVLPLEWTFYHREKLTDNYVDTLFNSNRDYYQSMPLNKRIARSLSLPPATVISKIKSSNSTAQTHIESPAQDLFVSALTQPTGHQSRATSSGPGAGVAEQSCDDYILGKAQIRQNLKLSKNVKPALARLKKLKARGINIHFAWPVLTGEGCLTAPAYVEDFRTEIEAVVNNAGFEFFGTPSQSLYSQAYQDDSPYHVITEAADIHTKQMIGFLKAEGYGSAGEPLNITHFARHRLMELELAEAKQLDQSPLKLGETLLMDNPEQRDQIDFTAGWWAFEPYGRWMRDNRAMFRVTLPNDLPSNTVLKIQGITKSGRPEQVNVSVNGVLISSGMFGESVSLSVPVTDLPRGEALSVFIDLPDAGTPQSPKELGENQDARSMTLHLQSMTLAGFEDSPVINLPNPIEDTPAEPVANKQTSLNVTPVEVRENSQSILASEIPNWNFVLPGNSCRLDLPLSRDVDSSIKYGEGWWAQEAQGRWMQGQEASFNLTLPQSTKANGLERYTLRLIGDFFSEIPQAIGIKINGKSENIATIANNGVISLPFETTNNGEPLNVTLELSTKNLKSPKDLGLSMDERTLTYFLKSAELVPS